MAVVILLVLYNHFFTFLAWAHLRHAGGDWGITRKCRNHEAPRITRKVLVAIQRQHWRKTNTETMHQQLQLVTVITGVLNSEGKIKICQTFEVIR